MANTNSSLVNKMLLMNKYFTKKNSKKVIKITPHHAAGVKATLEGMKRTFENYQCSANYGIDNDGKIALYVNEKDRAWTSSNSQDKEAVTIEIANCKGAPNWEISDKAYKAMIDLMVDICTRNGMKELVWTGDKKGSLTCHYMFKATACPGPYLKSKMPEIAKEVTKRLKANEKRKLIDYYKPVFNAEFYARKYPFLKAGHIETEEQLFDNFYAYGMKKGRQGNEEFNLDKYIDAHPALLKKYGNDFKKYYIYYIEKLRKGN